MKKSFVILLCTFTTAVYLWAQEVPTVFNWAFVKRGAGNSPVKIDFKERVDVASGDLFKIYLEPIHGAFIYLFLDDAQGNLQVLFPKSFDLFDNNAYQNQPYFIPEGENWFVLDNAKGTERFYLTASFERLRPLEAKVMSYQKASESQRGAGRMAVLDEIARLRREHSRLTIPAEKPVTIAGGTRGINGVIQRAATRIEAQGFYYKLFRLEH